MVKQYLRPTSSTCRLQSVEKHSSSSSEEENRLYRLPPFQMGLTLWACQAKVPRGTPGMTSAYGWNPCSFLAATVAGDTRMCGYSTHVINKWDRIWRVEHLIKYSVGTTNCFFSLCLPYQHFDIEDYSSRRTRKLRSIMGFGSLHKTKLTGFVLALN